MKFQLFSLLATVALSFALTVPTVASAASNDGDVYQEVLKSIDQARLQQFLKDMTGQNPVTVGSETFSISERYSAASKAKFRKYWSAYFRSLGMTVSEMAYKTAHTQIEASGHNLEAVLPGKSKDSIVIIVHYDSIGPWGSETSNAGVDDDMTGMAMMLEEARILAQYKDRLQHTVRFVAADFEEWSSPGLEGARKYATYIQDTARAQGFTVTAAIDNEQSGWNCAKDGMCGDDSKGDTFDVFSCAGPNQYNYSDLGDALARTAAEVNGLRSHRSCMGENSDHYAMWEAGIPAVVFSEHNPFSNDHFDGQGGDTYERIDQEYFFKIAQAGIVFAAHLTEIH